MQLDWQPNLIRLVFSLVLTGVSFQLQAPVAQAAKIFASGQRLTQAPDTKDDIRENFIFAIDSLTGLATPVSPRTSGLPSALAGTPNQTLLGFASGGQLVEVNPFTAAITPIRMPSGLEATGFDVLADGRGFVIPFDAAFNTQQLHRLDLQSGQATPIGAPTAIGDAIDVARNTDLGTATPFIISLGSVGNTLYGIDLDTDSLIRLDPETGEAAVVGDIGAVSAQERSQFSGFAALTGVDTDQDGEFDALFGNVNFVDDDNDPTTPAQRLGGVAQYNLNDGTWSLIGTNPGIIFFGFGSSPASVPEPTGVFALVSLGTTCILMKVKRGYSFKQSTDR